MKSILLSIQPKWVCEILNGRKTIEIRRKFPKDYVGWVYIYCTKYQEGYTNRLVKFKNGNFHYIENFEDLKNTLYEVEETGYTGKVVARFWCDKVYQCPFDNSPFPYNKLNVGTCLTQEEIEDYAYTKKGYQTLYAIHISKLEVFDKPKELSEFKHWVFYKKCEKCPYGKSDYDYGLCSQCCEIKPLTKAPKNYCYVEGERK